MSMSLQSPRLHSHCPLPPSWLGACLALSFFLLLRVSCWSRVCLLLWELYCSCWSHPSHLLPLALSLCVHTRACYPSFPRTLRRLSPTLTGPCAPLGPSFHRKIVICVVSRHTLNPLHHSLDCFHVHSSETVFLKATPEAASQTCSRCHHSGPVLRRAPPLGLKALQLASSSY